MTNSIPEIRDSEMMFIIGSNTSEAHPIIAMEMKRARQRGAGVVRGSVVDDDDFPGEATHVLCRQVTQRSHQRVGSVTGGPVEEVDQPSLPTLDEAGEGTAVAFGQSAQAGAIDIFNNGRGGRGGLWGCCLHNTSGRA